MEGSHYCCVFSSFATFLLSPCIYLDASISVLAVATSGTAMPEIVLKYPKKALSGLNLWCNLWLHFKELSKDLNLSQRWCLLAEARLQDTLVHSP